MKKIIEENYGIKCIAFIKITNRVFRIKSDKQDYVLKYIDRNVNESIFAHLAVLNTSRFVLPLKNKQGSYLTNYDLYLIVNRTGADKDSVICGQSGDITNQTVASSNSGGIENVTIKITGTEGDYKVSYQVGNSQYPVENYAEGAPFICGNAIDLLIISSERGIDNDTSEINLFIKNESDLAVNAAIVNDDVENPRININNVEGAVTFYQ